MFGRISNNGNHSFLVILLLAISFNFYISISAKKVLICYYGSWAVYRPGEGKFDVENINPKLCTHIIYSFAGLGPDNKIKALDAWNDLEDNSGKGAYKRFTKLKSSNPELKALLAIGGWNEGSSKYSKMASDKQSRATFIDSAIELVKKYNFDGLDIDWEYPANRGGTPEDKQNYALLLQEMQQKFKPANLLITVAVSAGKSSIDTAYNIPEINKYVDYINVMCYDYHGAFDKVTGLNAPLYSKSTDSGEEKLKNVDASIKYWISKGASASKLVLGIPTYGRSFTLQNAQNNGLNAPASGPGVAGQFTREAGTLGYNEICQMQSKWKITFDDQYKVPYGSDGTLWVGYDDVKSVGIKAEYINKMNLAGGMIWSLETDDFLNKCGKGNFPLLNAIRQALDSNKKVSNEQENGNKDRPTKEKDIPSGSSTTTTSTTTTTPTPNPENKGTNCNSEGWFRDPKDCSKFFRCTENNSNFSKHEFNCPSGTLFDNVANVCNYKSMVKGC